MVSPSLIFLSRIGVVVISPSFHLGDEGFDSLMRCEKYMKNE